VLITAPASVSPGESTADAFWVQIFRIVRQISQASSVLVVPPSTATRVVDNSADASPATHDRPLVDTEVEAVSSPDQEIEPLVFGGVHWKVG
jgi:hypothetical protein